MKRKRKIWLIVLLVLIVITLSFVAIYFSIVKSIKTYSTTDFKGLDMQAVEDGNYSGNEDGGIVEVTVDVTVKDHKITNITIVKHENGKGKPAEVIVNDIIKNNSVEVDAISGATYSSDVIKKAVYNALTPKK